jgi:dynein heavy chain
MTLTNALRLSRGGAPQGPAGTGKTETVKDLGKALAIYVVIQNCGDQMDQNDLGKIFTGLAQAGAWGCFDEFNRILLDVLSVITSQVQGIMDCLKKGDKEQCNINDKIILVARETGLFITMNPGYAGRSELPDNLANLFRPVAMMAPDFFFIVKITLMSEGFKQNEVLAKKVVTIYELMLKQLSKQDHYDFGMRAVKSVLNSSGRIKRDNGDLDETSVMIKAIRDMNLPKFIAEDVVLFDNLFMDLFPDCEEPQVNTDELQLGIEDTLTANGLQLNENLVVKIMQLYEYKTTRHGNMLVGLTQSGKSRAWQSLQEAMNLLHKDEREKDPKKDPMAMKYKRVVSEVINPKSINVDEFFGYYDLTQKPKQWMEGVCSALLKQMCSEPDQTINRWLIMDGPIDTLWIESMNSVLDDNKLLTLNNGDRIALTPNVRLLFEVQDLSVASPATVSRAGMVYMDVDELGYQPYLEMWIKKKTKQQGEDYGNNLKEWVQKYMLKVL